MGGGGLDFGNQPSVFKTYPGVEGVVGDYETPPPDVRLSELFLQGAARKPLEWTLKDLSLILGLTHSITAKARYSGVDFYYRSVASAGALYPFELYVAASGVAGLRDGLYHHSVADGGLRPLRGPECAAHIAAIVNGDTRKPPPLAFFLTSIVFRSSWKYRDRSYRYLFLDTGHLAENLSLALKARKAPYRVIHDFDDAAANRILCVDETREFCLLIFAVDGKGAETDVEPVPLSPCAENLRDASRVSARETAYPVIRAVHEAGMAIRPAPQAPPVMLDYIVPAVGPEILVKRADPWPEEANYAQALRQRRSMRNYVDRPLARDAFAALLETVWSAYDQYRAEGNGSIETLSVGFLSGEVEGLDPGFYLLNPAGRAIRLVSEGRRGDITAHVCLGQSWLSRCALHFVMLTNLRVLEDVWGPRGYRYAMLNAGRIGQRIYLAATAMRLGCCGIGAYFDFEAAQLLGLDADAALLYLIAAGPVKKYVQPKR
jgi:SagB-type dehydrogenase family enzyme